MSLPQGHWNVHHQKTRTNAGTDVEERKLLCTFGGNINWCGHYRKQAPLGKLNCYIKRMNLNCPSHCTQKPTQNR